VDSKLTHEGQCVLVLLCHNTTAALHLQSCGRASAARERSLWELKNSRRRAIALLDRVSFGLRNVAVWPMYHVNSMPRLHNRCFRVHSKVSSFSKVCQ
jgi:hypothetical protein